MSLPKSTYCPQECICRPRTRQRLVVPMAICPKGREEWLRIAQLLFECLGRSRKAGTHKDGKSSLATLFKKLEAKTRQAAKTGQGNRQGRKDKNLGFRPSLQGSSPPLASGIYRDIFLDTFKSQKSIQEELDLGRQ